MFVQILTQMCHYRSSGKNRELNFKRFSSDKVFSIHKVNIDCTILAVRILWLENNSTYRKHGKLPLDLNIYKRILSSWNVFSNDFM